MSISDSSSGNYGSVSRRSFLCRSIAAATVAAAGGATATVGKAAPLEAKGKGRGPAASARRANHAFKVREKCAHDQRALGLKVKHSSNGDEELYPSRVGNFTKGLPSDGFGEVQPQAYDALLSALESGEPADFEAIPHGAASPPTRLKFVNPQAAFAYDLEGADSHALVLPPAPAFASAEIAGEILESYWMALARDIPFTEYESNPLIQSAANDLSLLSDFRGPKIGGRVTPQTLFRDDIPGATVGPYLSQFLLLPVPFGANYIDQRMRTCVPGTDFATTYADWLGLQRGEHPSAALVFDPTRRFIRSGRDLGQWVHVDVLFQAYFQAMLILLTPPNSSDANGGGIGAPFDAANPYADSLNQVGFGTFGGPHIATLMCEISTRALKAVWYQKWAVHRRLRPEAFAGRVHQTLSGMRSYPLAVAELQNSPALGSVHERYGSYLLPLAFPEGCPIHPSYGAGHATVAGACVTLLKAWFNQTYTIPRPVVPSSDGLTLLPYKGPALTVEGELNKLASNIATGRNIAGVHWRSDAAESLRLGEAVAISVLRDQKLTYNETFAGFSLNTFDGVEVTI